MLIGYVRVSTNDQNTALQINALECAGCEQVFEDKISGTKAERPGLKRALKHLSHGDTLVVWKLDRLGEVCDTWCFSLKNYGRKEYRSAVLQIVLTPAHQWDVFSSTLWERLLRWSESLSLSAHVRDLLWHERKDVLVEGVKS